MSAAECGERARHVGLLHRTAHAEIEARDQEQHRQGRGELDQDRDAADHRRHAEPEPVLQSHHHAHIRESAR